MFRLREKQWASVCLAGCLVPCLAIANAVWATDWITAPSTYTHAPNGQRVSQYEPLPPVQAPPRGDYARSGYRHTRSSLQVGGSADHYHVVEEFGRPVRPYDEWRFPLRPYSAPYPLWGPNPAVYAPWGGAAWGGWPGPGPVAPSPPVPGPLTWPNADQLPWFDGGYRDYDRLQHVPPIP